MFGLDILSVSAGFCALDPGQAHEQSSASRGCTGERPSARDVERSYETDDACCGKGESLAALCNPRAEGGLGAHIHTGFSGKSDWIASIAL